MGDEEDAVAGAVNVELARLLDLSSDGGHREAVAPQALLKIRVVMIVSHVIVSYHVQDTNRHDVNLM